MVRHSLSYILKHLRIKRSDVHLYARPKGDHVHIDRDCPMLAGSQFEHYHYKEIHSLEADRRKLYPCSCLMKWLVEHGVKEESINLLGG